MLEGKGSTEKGGDSRYLSQPCRIAVTLETSWFHLEPWIFLSTYAILNTYWSFGKHRFTKLCLFSKGCHISLYSREKITFINIITNYIRKVLNYCKITKLPVADRSVSKFWYLLESSDSIISHKFCQLFPWRLTAHFQ